VADEPLQLYDGSDGLAGGMTGRGLCVPGSRRLGSGDDALLIECAIVAAGRAAFLPFNFPPARFFMGRCRFRPIGFLAAALSSRAGATATGLCGSRQRSLLLSSPMRLSLAEADRRRGALLGSAHKHYYQRFVRMGWGHRTKALAEYALIARLRHDALWALRRAAVRAAVALIGQSELLRRLALWVDHAWRRREDIHVESRLNPITALHLLLRTTVLLPPPAGCLLLVAAQTWKFPRNFFRPLPRP